MPAHISAADSRFQPSTLSTYLAVHKQPPTDLSSSTEVSSHHYTLALQIQYNLQYQHSWTSLTIHTSSPSQSGQLLPRPLISGLPPRRIYVHPDDQLDELKRGLSEEEAEVEREWVLPTQLREKWSLKRLAEVFDSIEETPPDPPDDISSSLFEEDDDVVEEEESEGLRGRSILRKAMAMESENVGKKRRGGKRLLLATMSDDSTVVYYVVHDGIVKPRQN